MENNLLMDFTVDKEKSTVHIKREFNASLDHVWSAWTEPELLDQWWAPAPFKSKTKSMEFKEGGRRLYAMVGPEGQEKWSFFEYSSISPKTNFKHSSTFCDSESNPDPNIGSSYWDLTFSEQGDLTIVAIAIKRNSLAELEKIIETGFREGFTLILKNLDTLLEEKNK